MSEAFRLKPREKKYKGQYQRVILAQARIEKGLTMRQVAELIGISHDYYICIENCCIRKKGSRQVFAEPSLDIMNKLCNLLDLSIDEVRVIVDLESGRVYKMTVARGREYCFTSN